MNGQLPMEEKLDLLKNGLNENLKKKHALELQINQQFEELRKLEISLEKCSRPTTSAAFPRVREKERSGKENTRREVGLAQKSKPAQELPPPILPESPSA
jgi:hypothetical protein